MGHIASTSLEIPSTIPSSSLEVDFDSRTSVKIKSLFPLLVRIGIGEEIKPLKIQQLMFATASLARFYDLYSQVHC